MVIYKITNLLNEKIYIGQTKQPIEKRFLQHSKANSPLGQAMRDCGLENFTIEVIERYQNELNEREKFWIKVLKSKSPNGYNLSNGGEGSFRRKKDIHFLNTSFNRIEVSTKIANLRKDFDLTQKELSDKIGMNQSVLNRIEKGTRPIRYDELKNIADYFNVSTDYLLGRDDLNRNAPLSSEHQKLLHGFDGLNEESKRLILGMIGQLNVARASIPTTTLTM